jgi:hypothetical protein
VIDFLIPYALAQFWSEVVGHPLDPEFVPSDIEVVIEPPGGPQRSSRPFPRGNLTNQQSIGLLPDGDTTGCISIFVSVTSRAPRLLPA